MYYFIATYPLLTAKIKVNILSMFCPFLIAISWEGKN